MLLNARLVGQGIVGPIVLTDPFAQFAVAPGDEVALDPWMLVWRDRLRSHLAAEPVSGVRENHRPSEGECCTSSGYTAETSSDDQYVCVIAWHVHVLLRCSGWGLRPSQKIGRAHVCTPVTWPA